MEEWVGTESPPGSVDLLHPPHDNISKLFKRFHSGLDNAFGSIHVNCLRLEGKLPGIYEAEQ
jgi:hypothetical protein